MPLDTHPQGWEVGKRYIYRLTLTTTVAFGTKSDAFDFDLEGNLQITPTAVTTEIATLHATIDHANIVSRIVGTQPDYDKIAAQLNSTVCFFTLAGGRIADMRIAKGLSGIVANMYRELGSGLQFSRSIQNVTRYAAEEYDTTGQYVAEYEQVNQNLWRKRKQRYLSLLGDKTTTNALSRIVPEVVASQIDVTLAPSGRPTLVKSRNDVIVNGAQVPVRSTTTLVLESNPQQSAPQPTPNWNQLLAMTERLAPDEPYGSQATIEALDDARIQGQSFESILGRLEQLGKDPSGNIAGTDSQQSTEEASRLFVGLAAIFRRRPDTIVKAMQKINAKSSASVVLVNALGSASTPAAQDALVKLLKSTPADSTLRPTVFTALTRTAKPSEQSIEALKAMLVEAPFSAEAMFGLGTYSRRLREQGKTEQAAALGELLLERLKAAEGSASVVTVLRAITNSGYSAALPQVLPHLIDEGVQVRVAAVRALQSMRDPKIDGLIATRLGSDPSSEVRISAMDAAQVREPTDTLTHAAVEAATRAQDPRVRYRAMELLIQWIPQNPTLHSTLEQIAQNDAEARLRDRAAAALMRK